MWNSATKEFWGSNIPHIAIVANQNELIDQSINQFGNTAVVFGGGYLTDKLLSGVFHLLNKGQPLTKSKGLWMMLGKSYAIYSMIAAYVIASPFLRNYITLKRTKADNFVSMVGLAKNQSSQSQEQVDARANVYLQKFTKVFGTGLGLAVGIAALSQILMRTTQRVPLLFRWLHRIPKQYGGHFLSMGLPKGRYQSLRDQAALLFWAMPAYIGLFAGSRDAVEKKETLFKAGAFTAAFMVLPRLLEGVANRFLKGRQFRVVGPGENIAFLLQLVAGVIFYGSVPSIVNLVMRKDRAKNLGLLGPQGATRYPVNFHEKFMLPPASPRLQDRFKPALLPPRFAQ